MTTEDDFQRQLDAHPDDWQTRLVFADWLDERGDPRADGYRVLGRFKREASLQVRAREGCMICVRDVPKWRRDSNRVSAWCLWRGRVDMRPGDSSGWRKLNDEIHPDWFRFILGEYRHGQMVFDSRRAAEDAAAKAFARLPTARRAELLGA